MQIAQSPRQAFVAGTSSPMTFGSRAQTHTGATTPEHLGRDGVRRDQSGVGHDDSDGVAGYRNSLGDRSRRYAGGRASGGPFRGRLTRSRTVGTPPSFGCGIANGTDAGAHSDDSNAPSSGVSGIGYLDANGNQRSGSG